MYEITKDNFDSKHPWKLKMPGGFMGFRTKRAAVAIKEACEVADKENGITGYYATGRPIFSRVRPRLHA